MDHGFFIHSPPEGHLGCFQVWAIMNKAAINIHAQVLCRRNFQFIWVNTKEHDCWIKRTFGFVGNCRTAFRSVHRVAFPPAVTGSSHRSASSPALGAASVLDFGHSHGCEVVPHCCFNWHFHDDMMWSIFSYARFPSS
uniref:Uncharacterized protein n=1 Tax=Rousettus aegyptiacus TaxID=9407 RepID=A0A7J8HRN8_ROUAE|nr:hypothetical protein HJG63_010880 [Rousettus aegyptiacus]